MERNAPIAHIYRFGDFQIDTSDETLRRNGEKLNINRRTFGVLRLLVERAGEIVSKQEFFDTVWADTFVEDNSLTVAMTTLRKLLGDDPKQPKFIENLPRKGYRFIAEIKLAADPETKDSLRTNPLKRRRIVGILIAGLVLSFGVLALTSFDRFRSRSSTAPGRIESIAVLPFENQVPETQYISDGLTEGLIIDLAGLPDLRVINRNSVFLYKNTKKDLRSAQNDLNVTAVVTGTVLQQDDNLVIDAKVTDLLTDRQIWEKRYEGKLTDLVGLRQNISRDLSEMLRSTSTTANNERLAKHETKSPEAYQFYLKGMYAWNRRTNADLIKAVEYFQQAISSDPTYAKAYLGLANCYAQGSFDYIESDKARNRMVQSVAKQALDIDPDLAGPYATRALMKTYYEWDWSGAENDYKLALERDPNDATAHHWYAELMALEGRFDESLAEYDRALELDPLSMAIRTDVGITYYYAGQYDRAIEYLKRSEEIDRTYSRTYLYLAEVYQAKEMYTEAIDEYEKYRVREGDDLQALSAKIAAFREALKTSGAIGYWQYKLRDNLAGGNAGIDEAMFYLKIGERDKAFEYLEKSYAKHQVSLVNLKVKHEFDEIRDDPRFADLTRRVGL